MNVSLVLGILLTAHGSFTYYLVCVMHLQLLVNQAASPGTVHTLPCVHAQLLQVLCQPCPCIAAGHALVCVCLGANLQGSGEVIGNGLPCCSMLGYS